MKNFVILILLSVLAIPCSSQDKPNQTSNLFEMSLDELLNISIASNVIKSDEQQPASVTTITQKQLQLSGARTLIEAIMNYVPGFFMIEDQDDLIAGFRGLAPDNNSKVLFLLNGQNLNTEWFWGPPAALLSSTQMSYIEKIEVIRGPGSVTLGQGALLGVINIVTKNGKSIAQHRETSGKISAGTGADEFKSLSVELAQNSKGLKNYFHFARTDYQGQVLRNEGWATGHSNDGYTGGMVYDIGTRLQRSFNTMLLGTMAYKGVNINMLYADNEHDLYNFYRDRNVMRQQLITIGADYKIDLTEQIFIKISGDAAIDNFSLKSVDNPIMGGTRENRGGLRAIANLNELIKGNRLAVGVETRFYQFGQENFDGNNFILNVYDQEFTDTVGDRARLDSANLYNIMGYGDSYMIFSAFAEDFYRINDKISAFGALRFDQHPFWGSNISPRLGFMSNPTNKLNIRLSYQAGFRGAVGLHYGGGYMQDGFLRADNYSEIANASIPVNPADINQGVYGNLEEVKPEMMHSYELSFDYTPFDKLNITAVGFYNQVKNVIDVGVIWADASQYIMPSIGSDVPGNWNGYWYFKNTEGTINQYGFELSAKLQMEKFSIGGSHSLVKLANADDQQKGSMYITDQDHFKAYPENVTRAHIMFEITNNIALSANYIYYYTWFSPRDQEADANHILNLSGMMEIGKHFTTTFTIKNLLGQKQLYPMNSNAGDTSLSDGTPALEKTTYWIKLSYNF